MTIGRRFHRHTRSVGACAATCGAWCLQLILTGCVGQGLLDNETIGSEGVVAFGAETNRAFSTRLAVGSRFSVTFRLADADADGTLAGAVLVSSNPAVFTVDGPAVTVVGPGTADLVVERQDVTVDRVTLRTAHAQSTTLASASLMAATDTVDARLPAAFAILSDALTTFHVAAVDRCGGDLLDLNASTLQSAREDVEVTPAGPATFSVVAASEGDAELVLRTPGLSDLALQVSAVSPSAIDEVAVAASAVDGSVVTLFGRAFADDLEIISPLRFAWTADERVTLEALEGLVVRADVAMPPEGSPADPRPASVTAEVFGESGILDLMTSGFVTSLGAPARTSTTAEPSSLGCDGEPCDPEAAALVGLWGLGRLRLLRRRVEKHDRTRAARGSAR